MFKPLVNSELFREDDSTTGEVHSWRNSRRTHDETWRTHNPHNYNLPRPCLLKSFPPIKHKFYLIKVRTHIYTLFKNIFPSIVWKHFEQF